MLRLFIAFALTGAALSSACSQYSSPESITYDSLTSRYFISNTAGRNIVQRDRQGNVTDFVNVGSSIHGVTVHSGRLYVCNGTRVRGYDLNSAAEVMNVQIAGSSFLNDLAADANGVLYISDFTARRIYKLNTADLNYWTYVASTGNTPNGVYVDAVRNRLLFCCWGSSAPIRAVNFADSSVTTLITTPYSNLDGISLDRNSNVYVSTWGIQSVVKYDINFTQPPVTVVSGLSNPADIYVNRKTDTLAIPNAGNSTVTFVNIGNQSGIVRTENGVPGSFGLEQNFPNPFNPSTVIRFSISEASDAVLSVYGTDGKLLMQEKFGRLATGIYSFSFNGSQLPSGTYFYSLKSGKNSSFRKMILAK